MAIDFFPDVAVSNARVVIPNDPLLTDEGEQTWMAWVTVASAASSGYRNIIADFSSTGLSLNIFFIGGAAFPSFRSWADGKAAANFDNIRLINSGWHHLCGTATIGGTLRLYIDGNLFATREGANVVNHNGVCTISGSSSSRIPFPGAIADARRYNRTMELEEIRSIYGARGRDTNFESLIARWILMENAPGVVPAGTVYDTGPNGLHGTAMDFTNAEYTVTDVAVRPLEQTSDPFTITS